MKTSRRLPFLLAFASLFATPLHGDNFSGFAIDFVEVKDEGNAADPETGRGSVGYDFRIGKFEISRSMVDAYNNNSSGPTLTLSDMSLFNSNGPNRPATGLSWNEAARFVNWLNTSQGFQAAYGGNLNKTRKNTY